MNDYSVGTQVKDSIGNVLQVVRKEHIFTIMKYVNKDGSLGKGEVWLVPSHLEHYKVIN